MASTSTPTYFDLVCPIPQETNLINVDSSPAAKPCEHCASLVPDRSNQYCHSLAQYEISASFERVDTFPEFPGLKASAKAGCSFCRLLRKTIRSSWTTIPMLDLGMCALADDVGSYPELLNAGWDRKVKIDNPVFRFSPFETFVYGMFSSETDESPPENQQGGVITGLSLSVHPAAEAVDEEGETPIDTSKTLSFKVYDSIDLKSPLPSTRRRLPDSSTLSPRNIEIMQDWIDTCKSAHGDRCQQVEAWNPNLLIDLGSEDTAVPRLVEFGKDSGETVKYAALSHLWGKEPDGYHPFQCYESNFEELKSGIELDLLNGNFLDAIAVCRALGIRYLWTDALCIIQDLRDGDGDVTEVHRVFRNAEVTLVPPQATHPNSCFLPRKLAGVTAAKLEYKLDEQKEYMIITPVEKENDGTREEDVDNSPWNKRGWTMIERIFSRRLIYFCPGAIYFECRWSLRSEETSTESTDGRICPLWPRQSEEDPEQFRAYYSECWINNLVEFSKRQMSRLEDRLPAFSNVAQAMSGCAEDSYINLAGMWLHNLQHELLWYPEGRGGRTTNCGYPSWSWASLDAKIGFIRGTTDCELPGGLNEKRFEALNAGRDSASLPGKGYVEVAGYCKKLSSLKVFDGDSFSMAMREEYPLDLVVGESQVLAHGALDLDSYDFLRDLGIPLYYLHVDTETHPTGLILLQDLRSETVFRRIGVATIFEVGGEILLDPPFETADYKKLMLV